MRVDVKEFLKRNGFSFYKNVDRGALWALGEHKVMVHRDYTHKQYELKLLQDAVHRSVELHAKVKGREHAEFLKEVEEAKKIGEARLAFERAEKEKEESRKVPQTPEEHRAAQIAAAASMRDPAPEEVQAAPAAVKEENKVSYKKYAGEERVYVYGRVKYLIEKSMDTVAILKTLRAEGIKLPNGKQMNRPWVNQAQHNYKVSGLKKYEAIEHVRGAAIVPKPPLPKSDRPATIMVPAGFAIDAAKIAPRRLPTYVLAILQAPTDELTADDKVRMILAWAEGT